MDKACFPIHCFLLPYTWITKKSEIYKTAIQDLPISQALVFCLDWTTCTPLPMSIFFPSQHGIQNISLLNSGCQGLVDWTWVKCNSLYFWVYRRKICEHSNLRNYEQKKKESGKILKSRWTHKFFTLFNRIFTLQIPALLMVTIITYSLEERYWR